MQIPYSNNSQSIKDGWPVSSSTDFPTKNAKSLTPLLEVGESEIGPKGGLVKLGRDGSRKIEYITIPYSNHSQNIEDGWLVSSSTGVPTNNAKSLTPLLQFGWCGQ